QVGDAPAMERADDGVGQVDVIEGGRRERGGFIARWHDSHASLAVRGDAGGDAAIGDSDAAVESDVAHEAHEPVAHGGVVADETSEAVNLHVRESGATVLDARGNTERGGEQGVLGRSHDRLDERATDEIRTAGTRLRFGRAWRHAVLAGGGIRL